jgi:Fic family protein
MGEPLLCSPEQKATLEADNGTHQLDYIAHLIHRLKIEQVRESHILELHQLAVQGIYSCGGRYRNAFRKVVIEGSPHQVPHESSVPHHVCDLVELLNDTAGHRPAIWRAAYTLWRLNWIHPFAGGNGRTARAFSYLILCMDMKTMLPGVPSMPSLIYQHRDEYVHALQAADASVRDGGEPDISEMEGFLQDIITRQLAAAIDHLSRSKP